MIDINLNKTGNRYTPAVKGDIYAPFILLDQFRYGISAWKAVKATGSFTLTANPLNNETMTIGSRVYTFKTTLTSSSSVDEIKIGGSLAVTQSYIVGAINGDQSLAGVGYGSRTFPHADVTIGAFSANVAVITANEGGIAGNSIATTETIVTDGSFGASTLTGGLDETTTDSILKPIATSYNMSSSANISQSIYNNHFSETNTMGQLYANLATAFDDWNYIANQSKKFGILSYTGGYYKRLQKVNITAILREATNETFGLTPTNNNVSELDPATNKFVIGDGNTQLQVIQINADGSVTKGTVFTHTNPVHRFVCVDTTKIVGIRNIAVGSYEVMYFTVSGTTISAPTTSTIAVTGSGNSSQIDIAKIATGKAVMAYRNNATTFGARIADVTGALSISGSDTVITPPAINYFIRCRSYDTDKFCLYYGEDTTANSRIWAGTATGTAIALGSAYTPTVPFTTMLSGDFNYFDAETVNTTNMMFSGYNAPNVGTLSPCFEQISIAGTVITFVRTFDYFLQGSFSPSNVKMIKVTATKIVFMAQSMSGFNSSMYNTSNMLLEFDISGSTVTPSYGHKNLKIFNVAIPSKYWLMFKVGSFFFSWVTTAQYVVHKPISVELYNHETLITTASISLPFTDTTIDLTSFANAYINDINGYLKIKNIDSQTNKIRVTLAQVEME